MYSTEPHLPPYLRTTSCIIVKSNGRSSANRTPRPTFDVWYSLPLMAFSAFPSQCGSSATIVGRQQCTLPRNCYLLKPFKCQVARKLANTDRTPASLPLSRTDNAPRNGVPFVPLCATPTQPSK